MTKELPCLVLFDLGGVLTCDPWESIVLTEGTGLADTLGLDRRAAENAGRALWGIVSVDHWAESMYWDALGAMLDTRVTMPMVEQAEASLLCVNPTISEVFAAIRDAGASWGVISDNTYFWYEKQKDLLLPYGDSVCWEFLSFRHGTRKRGSPRGLYHIASERVDAARTVVIDDRQHNLVAARACGFEARLYSIGSAETPLVDILRDVFRKP